MSFDTTGNAASQAHSWTAIFGGAAHGLSGSGSATYAISLAGGTYTFHADYATANSQGGAGATATFTSSQLIVQVY